MDADRILRQIKRKPIVEVSDFAEISYTKDEIKKLIPHREPFLLIDEIKAVDYEQGVIIGERTISIDDPIFKGHFPDYPVYPGVLEIEMIGQLGLCLHYFVMNNTNEVQTEKNEMNVRATKILGATFVNPVLPGKKLTIISKKVEYNEYFGTIMGQVLCDDKICCVSIGEVVFI